MNETAFKVCLVSPLPPPQGGIANWTVMLHRWIEKNTNINLMQVDTAPRWRAIDDLSIFKRVIGGGMQLLRDYWRFLVSVRRADVIHLVTSGQLATVRDILICATANILNIPVCYHLHFGRIPEIAQRNTVEWRMLLYAMKCSKTVLALDLNTANTINKYLPFKRVAITPNPVDPTTLPTQSSFSSNKKRLLFLGHVIPAKGVEDIIMAWQGIIHEDWELVLVGPCNQSYQEDLIKRFAPQSLCFYGEVPHGMALQMIADSDLFVLPSHTEAFPFAVLEAMVLGKAIVATKVGAIPEMLEGECGVLVEPRDIQGLGIALKTLLEDEELRNEFGVRARKRALEHYTIDAVFTRLRELWINHE
jgi:glycosyltransferase involved in cell wall biosynthesis